jgi:hypothetical protein
MTDRYICNDFFDALRLFGLLRFSGVKIRCGLGGDVKWCAVRLQGKTSVFGRRPRGA